MISKMLFFILLSINLVSVVAQSNELSICHNRIKYGTVDTYNVCSLLIDQNYLQMCNMTIYVPSRISFSPGILAPITAENTGCHQTNSLHICCKYSRNTYEDTVIYYVEPYNLNNVLYDCNSGEGNFYNNCSIYVNATTDNISNFESPEPIVDSNSGNICAINKTIFIFIYIILLLSII